MHMSNRAEEAIMPTSNRSIDEAYETVYTEVFILAWRMGCNEERAHEIARRIVDDAAPITRADARAGSMLRYRLFMATIEEVAAIRCTPGARETDRHADA